MFRGREIDIRTGGHGEQQLDRGKQKVRQIQQDGKSPSGLDLTDIIPLSLFLFFPQVTLTYTMWVLKLHWVVIHEGDMKYEAIILNLQSLSFISYSTCGKMGTTGWLSLL